MGDLQERIGEIEKEIRETPYHKATERHIGRLRAKLAKLREKTDSGTAGKVGGSGYAIPKSGDATVVLVGPPSVGKSTLLNTLTGAKSKVAEYEFTTLKVIPGMLEYNGAKIQILDIPGLVSGAAEGKGRGKQVLSVVRIADLILLMTDLDRRERLWEMEKELLIAGLSTEKMSILRIVNKADIGTGAVREDENIVYISAKSGKGVAKLKKRIWEELELIRVYLRNDEGKVDYSAPLIVGEGTTILSAAARVSAELAKELKGARIWGTKAKHPGQIVSLKQKLFDEAVLHFVT